MIRMIHKIYKVTCVISVVLMHLHDGLGLYCSSVFVHYHVSSLFLLFLSTVRQAITRPNRAVGTAIKKMATDLIPMAELDADSSVLPDVFI